MLRYILSFLFVVCLGNAFSLGEEATVIVDDEEVLSCTQEYKPVCGLVEVECITAPCLPIAQTFQNMCGLSALSRASYIYDGECQSELTLVARELKLQLHDLVSDDKLLGTDWYISNLHFYQDNRLELHYEDGDHQSDIELFYEITADGDIFFVTSDLSESNKVAYDRFRIAGFLDEYFDRFVNRTEQLMKVDSIKAKIDIMLDSDLSVMAEYYLTLIKDYLAALAESLRH